MDNEEGDAEEEDEEQDSVQEVVQSSASPPHSEPQSVVESTIDDLMGDFGEGVAPKAEQEDFDLSPKKERHVEDEEAEGIENELALEKERQYMEEKEQEDRPEDEQDTEDDLVEVTYETSLPQAEPAAPTVESDIEDTIEADKHRPRHDISSEDERRIEMSDEDEPRTFIEKDVSDAADTPPPGMVEHEEPDYKHERQVSKGVVIDPAQCDSVSVVDVKPDSQDQPNKRDAKDGETVKTENQDTSGDEVDVNGQDTALAKCEESDIKDSKASELEDDKIDGDSCENKDDNDLKGDATEPGNGDKETADADGNDIKETESKDVVGDDDKADDTAREAINVDPAEENTNSQQEVKAGDADVEEEVVVKNAEELAICPPDMDRIDEEDDAGKSVEVDESAAADDKEDVDKVGDLECKDKLGVSSKDVCVEVESEKQEDAEKQKNESVAKEDFVEQDVTSVENLKEPEQEPKIQAAEEGIIEGSEEEIDQKDFNANVDTIGIDDGKDNEKDIAKDMDDVAVDKQGTDETKDGDKTIESEAKVDQAEGLESHDDKVEKESETEVKRSSEEHTVEAIDIEPLPVVDSDLGKGEQETVEAADEKAPEPDTGKQEEFVEETKEELQEIKEQAPTDETDENTKEQDFEKAADKTDEEKDDVKIEDIQKIPDEQEDKDKEIDENLITEQKLAELPKEQLITSEELEMQVDAVVSDAAAAAAAEVSDVFKVDLGKEEHGQELIKGSVKVSRNVPKHKKPSFIGMRPAEIPVPKNHLHTSFIINRFYFS